MNRLAFVPLVILLSTICYITSGQSSDDTTFSKSKRLKNIEVVEFDGYSIPPVGNALNALSELSSINVDANGDISILGNKSLELWINGSPSGIIGRDVAPFLKRLSASDITKVEIKPYPDAENPSNGVGGIISIYLRQDSNSDLSLEVSTLGGYSLSSGVGKKRNKWSYYLKLDYDDFRNLQNYKSYTVETRLHDTIYSEEQDVDRIHSQSGMVRTGGLVEITDVDRLGFEINQTLNREVTNEIAESIDYNGDYSATWKHSNSREWLSQGVAKVDYRHRFKSTDFFRFMVVHGYSSDNERKGEEGHDLLYPLPEESYSSFKQTKTHYGRGNVDFSAELSMLFCKKAKLNMGYYVTFNERTSKVRKVVGSEIDSLAESPSDNNDFKHNFDIHSLFITTGFDLKKMQVKVGVRGEYTHESTLASFYEILGISNSISKKSDYVNLFPSLRVSYILNGSSSFTLNLNRRIRRPTDDQLNLFPSVDDSSTISIGNPNLKPEFSNVINLIYTKKWDNGSFSFSGFFRTNSNMIQEVRYIKSNILFTSYANVTRMKSAGFQIDGTQKITQNLKVKGNFSGYYYTYKAFVFGETGMPGKSDYRFTAKTSVHTSIGAGINCVVNGEYSSSLVRPLGIELPTYDLDLVFTKSILEDKVDVSFAIKDVLNSNQKRIISDDKRYYLHEHYTYNRGRYILISFSWNL